jgi:glycosyltransferase involved in cell wall biosynthesis
MDILHFVETTDARMGGVPRFVLDASRAMSLRGHRVRILTLDAADSPPEWLEPVERRGRPRVIVLSKPAIMGRLFSAAQSSRIGELLAGADAVHLHCVWSVPTLQIAAAARRCRVPYVVSLHGMLDDWSMSQRNFRKRAFMTLGARRMLERASRVHATAEAELDQSAKWYPAGASVVIPCLMDLEPFRRLPSKEMARDRFPMLAEGKPNVLFLSRLHVKKGCEHLIGAAARLASGGIDANYFFAGSGEPSYVRRLRDLAARLGVGRCVHFLGQVAGDCKISLYRNADAFVLPSSQENFGLVLVEALCCGVPVMTTKGVDIWRDIQSSGAATIVPQESQAIATELKEFFASSDSLRARGDAARRWAMSTYCESKLTVQYEQLYRDVAEGRGCDPSPAGRRRLHPA